MWLTIRTKLVALALVTVLASSVGFTLLHLKLSRRWVEEDLEERAVTFAREVAATIGDRRELESAAVLRAQIREIVAVRRNVEQLDILRFTPEGAQVVATTHPARRLPLTHQDFWRVRGGRVVSRLVREPGHRYWEVVAPITLEGSVAGAVGAKFSLVPADALAARIRLLALGLTAASAAVAGTLMAAAAHVVVTGPLGRFLEAIRRVGRGETGVRVAVRSRDELGLLASHFNDMLAQLEDAGRELQTRVARATEELRRRYAEVERLNAQLFAVQRRLSHAERLALAGRLVAEVAHEVGTPLHSVAGHLELLRQDLPPRAVSETVERRLKTVEAQLARVTEIITRLLDLTRRPRGTAGPVDLNQVVRDTVDLVRPGLVAAGLECELEVDEELPPIQGFRDQLQQVVLNLLTNAIDATPRGGRLRVATRRRSVSDEIEVLVADTGSGLPPGLERQIFEPFVTTKSPGRGSGLGLFIVNQIVRDHRGRIEVESAPGRGSTFRVLLPTTGAVR